MKKPKRLVFTAPVQPTQEEVQQALTVFAESATRAVVNMRKAIDNMRPLFEAAATRMAGTHRNMAKDMGAAYLIKFGEVNEDGSMFMPGSISL